MLSSGRTGQSGHINWPEVDVHILGVCVCGCEKNSTTWLSRVNVCASLLPFSFVHSVVVVGVVDCSISDAIGL